MKNKVLALLIGLTMVFASFTTAFAGNWIGLRSAGADDEVAVEKQVMNNLEMVKAGKYTAIDTAKMKSFVDSKAKGNKNIVIIDAMPQSSWDATHIPGAVCCETTMGKWMNAEYKLTAAQKNALKKAVKGKKKSTVKVITYCGFCQCDRSHFAAKYIKSLGYKNVYRYIGGGAAWEDSKYDFENSKGETVKAKTK